VPDGFRIEKFVEGLTTPRVIVVADNGTIYVSSRDDGTITMLRVKNGRADAPKIVLKKKDVHGLAVRGRVLFYTTVWEVFSAPLKDDGTLGRERRIAGDLPDAGQHANRTLGFSSDGLLYLSVGSTCNACEERNAENATMLRMRPDGKFSPPDCVTPSASRGSLGPVPCTASTTASMRPATISKGKN